MAIKTESSNFMNSYTVEILKLKLDNSEEQDVLTVSAKTESDALIEINKKVHFLGNYKNVTLRIKDKNYF